MFSAILARFFRKLVTNRKLRILLLGMAMLVIVLFVSTLGFWFFETDQQLSLFDSLWLSYVTMTTVGYGDLFPTTTAGRLLSVFITMTGGIGVVEVPHPANPVPHRCDVGQSDPGVGVACVLDG